MDVPARSGADAAVFPAGEGDTGIFRGPHRSGRLADGPGSAARMKEIRQTAIASSAGLRSGKIVRRRSVGCLPFDRIHHSLPVRREKRRIRQSTPRINPRGFRQIQVRHDDRFDAVVGKAKHPLVRRNDLRVASGPLPSPCGPTELAKT